MENLDIIKLNKLYKNIFSIVLKIGTENFNIIKSDATISFRPNNVDIYDFELVFWLNENRISFNIEDWYEIIDSYLENDKEALEVFDFIDTIFKNKVLIEKYALGKSDRIFKKVLTYTTKIDNKIQKLSTIKRLFFKLPWIKERLIIANEFNPIY